MPLKNSHKALFLLMFIIILMFVYGVNRPSIHDNSNTCIVYAQNCNILFDEGPVEVEILDQLVVEELIGVKISLPAALIIEQIHIEGINMYMGKSPVHQTIVNKVDGLKKHTTWEGEFFLGSCSLAEMHWRMVIELKDQEKVANVLFTTQQ